MYLSSVQQKNSVNAHGMRHYPTVRGYGILTGDALNAVKAIAAIILLQYVSLKTIEMWFLIYFDFDFQLGASALKFSICLVAAGILTAIYRLF